MKVALNEKRKKLHGFSFSINMANFEAFWGVKKLSANLSFLTCDEYYDIYDYDDQITDQICRTTSGSHKNQECQFPFIFRGTEYNTCITGSKRPQPWCPTELDSSQTYIRGKWGYCDTSKCPLGKLKFQNYYAVLLVAEKVE